MCQIGFGLEQKNRISLATPIQLEYQGKTGLGNHSATTQKVRRIIKGPGAGMGGVQILKKSGLSGFSRILKPGIIVRKNMGIVLPGHVVKWVPASLGQNDGIGGTDGGEVFFFRLPTGTKNVDIGIKAGMIRENHQYPNLRNALVSLVQFF